MERRVLLALFLSFLVLYASQGFFGGPEPVPPPIAQPAQLSPGAVGGPPAEVSPEVPSPAQPGSDLAQIVGDTAERDIRIETPNVVAVFTNRGARLKSWRLKKYLDSEGLPLELVATDLAATHALPFSLKTPDDRTTGALNSALYSVRGAPDAGAVQTAPTSLTFEYRSSLGLTALKEFTIDPGSYTVRFRATVSEGDRAVSPTIVWGPGLGDTDPQQTVKPGALFSSGGEVTRLAASGVEEQPAYDQTFDYAGIDDHYFMAIALEPATSTVLYQPLSIPPPVGSSIAPRELMSYSITRASAGEPTTFYVGPKDFNTLSAINVDLVKAINFGMFSLLVVPLLRSLNWLHGFVGNYGWSITLLTILINVVLFPLNHKSVVSMRKMQEIQPETKAIQERYAKLKSTDPARQKMNQELMALYRDRGVNPASGCIPILLTLPVFLAFYAMLQTAIELRGAPFIWWIHDLSLPDPYYVLPVLVGASQVVQQWMTPQTGGDPMQQKLMMVMPVVLIFVFVATPTGALIYWLVGNVFRIGQMQLTNYLIGPPHIRAIRPAAERRAKRVGSGKTDAAAREE